MVRNHMAEPPRGSARTVGPPGCRLGQACLHAEGPETCQHYKKNITPILNFVFPVRKPKFAHACKL